MDSNGADHSADSPEWVTAQPTEFNQCVGLPATRKWGQTTFQRGSPADVEFKGRSGRYEVQGFQTEL